MNKKEYNKVVSDIENRLRLKGIAITFDIQYQISFLLSGITSSDKRKYIDYIVNNMEV